jgi:hypothetical protein
MWGEGWGGALLVPNPLSSGIAVLSEHRESKDLSFALRLGR